MVGDRVRVLYGTEKGKYGVARFCLERRTAKRIEACLSETSVGFHCFVFVVVEHGKTRL